MEAFSMRLQEAYDHLPRSRLKHYTLSLSEILKCQKEITSVRGYKDKFKILTEEFESAAGHSVVNLLRKTKLINQLSYLDILKDVAEEMGYKARVSSTAENLEEEIVGRFLEKIWGELDDSQKENMRQVLIDTVKSQQLDKVDQDLIAKLAQSGTPFVAILAGNSAGFALYLSAVSGLYSVSSAIGLSLSFGTYTALTSGLSTMLGPLGLVAASAFATYRLGQPSYERKLIPCIMLLVALRGELMMRESASD